MKRALLVVGLAAAVALAGCGGGGGGDDANNSGNNSGNSSGTNVGPTGGTVTSGATTLTVPAGALNTTVQISATALPVSVVSTSTGKSLLAATACGPEGQTFSTPVSLTMPLGSAKTPFARLLVLVLNNSAGTWSGGNAAVVSASGTSATTTATHFSTFVILDSPTVDGRWNVSNGSVQNWGYLTLAYGSLSGTVISFSAEVHDSASTSPDPERILDGTLDLQTQVCSGTWRRPTGGGTDTGTFDVTVDAQLTAMTVTIKDAQGLTVMTLDGTRP